MRFFFDNTLSFRLARALDTLLEAEGHRVIALRDYPFEPSLRDEEWLSALRRDGDWIILTGDLSKKDKDRHVWKRSGLTVFFSKPLGPEADTSSQTSALASCATGHASARRPLPRSPVRAFP